MEENNSFSFMNYFMGFILASVLGTTTGTDFAMISTLDKLAPQSKEDKDKISNMRLMLILEGSISIIGFLILIALSFWRAKKKAINYRAIFLPMVFITLGIAISHSAMFFMFRQISVNKDENFDSFANFVLFSTLAYYVAVILMVGIWFGTRKYREPGYTAKAKEKAKRIMEAKKQEKIKKKIQDLPEYLQKAQEQYEKKSKVEALEQQLYELKGERPMNPEAKPFKLN